jgi:TRAP-type C4-dicarboxylate transport system permease small subunit
MMKKLRKILDASLRWILIVLMAVSVLNVLWQVFTRFVIRHPSSYTEELARYLLVWVGLLGAAYASGHKLHLAIDLFSHKMKPVAANCLEIFIQLCILFFAVFVMIVGGIRLVNITLTLNQISAALQVKLGYVYLVLPISGFLIVLYVLARLSELVGNLRHPGEISNTSETRTEYHGMD